MSEVWGTSLCWCVWAMYVIQKRMALLSKRASGHAIRVNCWQGVPGQVLVIQEVATQFSERPCLRESIFCMHFNAPTSHIQQSHICIQPEKELKQWVGGTKTRLKGIPSLQHAIRVARYFIVGPETPAYIHSYEWTLLLWTVVLICC